MINFALDTLLEQRLHLSRLEIAQFCDRWHILEFALFGSVLREDFDPISSDVDILATFDPAFDRGLKQAMQMQDELEDLCSRKVDILSRSSLEQSENWMTKRDIFDSAQVIYVR